MKIKSIFLTAAIFGLSAPVHAETSTVEGTHGEWTAYSRMDSGEKICYVLAKPGTKSPGNVKHGDIYFMVASWKSGAANEQPSFMAGYPLKSNSPPVARVGSAKFPMFVSQNEAFIENNGDESRLVKAMRDGSTMRVSAMSQRGTAVNYSFSLKGITAALKSAKSACS